MMTFFFKEREDLNLRLHFDQPIRIIEHWHTVVAHGPQAPALSLCLSHVPVQSSVFLSIHWPIRLCPSHTRLWSTVLQKHTSIGLCLSRTCLTFHNITINGLKLHSWPTAVVLEELNTLGCIVTGKRSTRHRFYSSINYQAILTGMYAQHSIITVCDLIQYIR